MKIRVEYTYELSDDDLTALQRYHGCEPCGRAEIKQLLEDEGSSGVDDQITQGRVWDDFK